MSNFVAIQDRYDEPIPYTARLIVELSADEKYVSINDVDLVETLARGDCLSCSLMTYFDLKPDRNINIPLDYQDKSIFEFKRNLATVLVAYISGK